MSVKDEAFNILDDWEMMYGDVHESRSEAALDLADELEISVSEAQKYIDKWIALGGTER